MKKRVSVYFSLLLIGILAACNATKKTGKPTSVANPADPTHAVAATQVADPVKTLPSGLQYQILKHGTGTRKPALGDKLEFILTVNIDDSLIFDSHTMNKNHTAPLQVAKPKFKGDPVEGYMELVEGDSARFWLPVDTLLKSGNKMPDWMKPGKKLVYNVVMESIKTEAEAKKEAESKLAVQKATDDSLLQDYFLKNNLHPEKTASGLYYIIKKEGTGNLAIPGNVLSMYYTGRLLNGNIFDTNQDSTFHHQDPLTVDLGKGRVIKGWDEGLQLLKKGSMATLYIPSGLAYGARDKGPIPANSVLIFDVTVKDIQTQNDIDEQALQNYFKNNKLKPLKSPEGVYYTIRKKGKGPVAKAGQTVTVKYSGMTIDGKKFDSNIDTEFHHTDPFKFELGKGRVIKGWDDGIALLNKGTQATLYIPSQMGYGSQGQGRKIPPNAILIFDVELVDIGSSSNLLPNSSGAPQK